MSSISVSGVDRKLNVALTRAREQIILVGNEAILSKVTIYKELINSSYYWNNFKKSILEIGNNYSLSQ